MAIPADQASKIVDSFKKALDTFYGSSVATLKQFQDSRRRSFMDKLEVELDAPAWRKKVADAVGAHGDAKGSVTRMEETRSSKLAEARSRHDQELAALREKQARELNEITAHYEPAILAAKALREQREREVRDAQRAAYFHGLGQEDDGRQLYNSRTSEGVGIDQAIREVVDLYMERNLGDDADGQKVLKRVKETRLVEDLAFFSKNVEVMRSSFLTFIRRGLLPAVTIEAWFIQDGRDMLAPDEPNH